MSPITPSANIIIATRYEPAKTTASGLILTEQSAPKANNCYVIEALGDNVSSTYKVGQHIVTVQHVEKTTINDKEYFLIADHQVLGIINQ